MDRILRVIPAVLAATGLSLALTAASAADLPCPELNGPAPSQAYRSPNEPVAEMPLAEAPQATTGGEASPLPTAETVRARSIQLEQVAQQADRQTQHGFELAGRKAYFAARSEFLSSLQLLAEALDTEQKTDVHRRALTTGWTALREADDFLPGSSPLESEQDLSDIVATHTTPVLKNATDGLTPLMALQSYLTFAQEQLATAVDHEVAGSMALRAMGKLYAAMAQNKNSLIVAPESKAVVFFQAAMLVYPKNYMAANDLGVLLAQGGRLADARTMLEHSVALCPQSTSWQNLAVVYRQAGQIALADQAATQAMQWRQAELARQRSQAGSAGDRAQWLDPQTFARASTRSPNVPTAMPRQPVQTTTAANRPAPAAASPWPAATPAAAQRMRWGTSAY